MIVLEETFQALPAFLTQPTRRRSGTCGSGDSMAMPLAVAMKGHQHSTDTNHNAHHYGQHNGGQMDVVRGGVQQLAAMSAAPQQAVRTTAADAQQELLARTTSSGPVTTRIHAAAICCPMESTLIHRILDNVPGVLSVEVMVVTKTVAVHHQPAAISPAALVAALNSAGLQASLNKHSTSGGGEPGIVGNGIGGACSSGCCGSGPLTSSAWQQSHTGQPRRGLPRLLAALRGSHSLPPLPVLAAALLLLVNLVLLLPALHMPALIQKGLLALLAALLAVPPVLKKAWMGLKNKNLDMNSLVTVALFGAIGLGDWFEAGALVLLFTLAEWLEERCVQRAAGAMEDILKLQPEEALVVQEQACGPLPQLASTCKQEPEQQQLGGCCAAAGHAGDQHHEHQSHSCSHSHAGHGGCGHQHVDISSCSRAHAGHSSCGHSNDEHSSCGHSHAAHGGCEDAAEQGQHHAQHANAGCAAAEQGQHQHGPSSHDHQGQSCCNSWNEVVLPCCSTAAGHSCTEQQQDAKTVPGGVCQGHHAHAGVNSKGLILPKAADHAAAVDQHSCHVHDSKSSACCSHADAAGVLSPKHPHHHQTDPQQQRHEQCGTAAHSHEQAAGERQQQSHHSHQHTHTEGCCGHDHSHQHHAVAAVASQCGDKQHQQQQQHHHDHGNSSCCQAYDHHSQHKHHLPLKSVLVAEIGVGVLVLVRPGDKVPVDGIIEHGTSVIDESMITGESKPVTKTLGETVLAGTINSGGVSLRVRSTAAAGDSTVARLGALMEAAASSKSRHERHVELFARYYTPTIVLAALLVAALGSAVQPAAWRHWTYMSLVVLVTGCPCALVISTPVASVASITCAAKKGVLIKGGRPLELLGNLTAASFDKSGTLTEGHFQVTHIHTFGPVSRQQALHLAALLEQHSNHPIAHAILGAAAAGGCMASAGSLGAMGIVELPGKGLQGTVNGQAVAVGSWAFAQEILAAAAGPADTAATVQPCTQGAGVAQQQHSEAAAALAEAKRILASADTAGSTVVCLVTDQQLAAVMLLSDRARSDAQAAVQQLQQLGVKCLMMTGDTMGAAAHVAGQLGIGMEDVCAELLPQEKLELINTLRLRLAAGKQRKQQAGGMASRWAAWCRARLQAAGAADGVCCRGCGEQSTDCSCRVALGPDNSSSLMQRSSSGGFKGTSSSGMRIDAAVRLPHAHSPGKVATDGIVIAHVGDGINDAPALAGADVGVAMGVAGAALAVDAADIALFSNNLTSLPFVVRLGRRARWVVAFNTAFACGIKLAVLCAAAGGVASLWLSLLADVGSSLLVTLHALTLLRFEAGRGHSSSDSSLMYGSRLSGIPLVGEHPDSQAGDVADLTGRAGGAGGSGSRAGATGANVSLPVLQWWRELVAQLPGASWLQPYNKLEDHTPAMSAGVSRLNSSSARVVQGPPMGASVASVPGAVLDPASAAAQELREMAILSCATGPVRDMACTRVT